MKKKKNLKLFSTFIVFNILICSVGCSNNNVVHHNPEITTEENGENIDNSENEQTVNSNDSEFVDKNDTEKDISSNNVSSDIEQPSSSSKEEENHEHFYIIKVVSPTCIAKGYTEYTCSCGHSYTSNEKATIDHQFGTWITTKVATQSTKGESERECSLCGKTETKELAKLEANHVHAYTKQVIKPTCISDGYTLYTCSCGDSYTNNETKKKGHKYDEGIWKTYATCTAGGHKEYTCTKCGAIYSEVTLPNGHDYDSGKIVTEATCTSEGVKTFTCSSCGNSYNECVEVIEHNYNKGKCTMCDKIIVSYEKKMFLDEFQGVSFNYTGIVCHWNLFYMTVEVTNDTDETITVQVRNDYVNGHEGLITVSKKIAPHKTEIVQLKIDKADLANYGEDIVEHVQFNFYLYYSLRTENQFHTSPTTVSFYPYE